MQEKRVEWEMGKGIPQKGLEFMAVFMCVLVITLPFYTSSVFALQFNSVTIVGDDGIPHYRAEEDSTTITASIASNSPLNHFNVRAGIGNSATIAFDSCSETLPYECSLAYDLATADGTVDFCVLSSTGEFSSATCSNPGNTVKFDHPVYVDTVGPKVESIRFNPAGVIEGDTEIEYVVTDSVSEIDTTHCSGLKGFAVYNAETQATVGSVPVAEEAGRAEQSNCRYQGSVPFPTESIPEGRHVLCVVPLDGVGNTHTDYYNDEGLVVNAENPASTVNCARFGKGATPPILGSFSVLDETGTTPLTFVSRSQEVQFKVEASTTTHELETVTLDLTSVEKGMVDMDCEEGEVGQYACITNQDVNFPRGGSIEVSITLTDAAGQVEEVTEIFSYEFDTTPPIVNAVVTNFYYDGESRISPQEANEVIVLLSEDGSGVVNEGILLTSHYGTVGDVTCSQEGFVDVDQFWDWQCKASFEHDEGSPVIFEISGQDNAGNMMDMTGTEFPIALDDAPPVFVKAVVHSPSTAPAEGQVLEVHVTFNEDFALTNGDVNTQNIKGTFSVLDGEVSLADTGGACHAVPGEGEEPSGQWECVFYLRDISEGKLTAKFTAKDLVGNTVEVPLQEEFEMLAKDDRNQDVFFTKQEINVLGITGVEANIWEVASAPTAAPPVVDGRLTKIMETNIWYNVPLQLQSDIPSRFRGSTLAAVELAGCRDISETVGDYSNYFDSSRSKVLYEETASPEPFLKLALKQGRLPLQQKGLNVTCELNVISKKNSRIMGEQRIPVNLTVKVGETLSMDNAVWDEIRSVVGEMTGGWDKFLDGAQSLIQVGATLCTTFTTIYGMVMGVVTVVDGIAVVVDKFPGGQTLARSMSTSMGFTKGVTESTVYKYANQFCYLFTCKFGPGTEIFYGGKDSFFARTIKGAEEFNRGTDHEACKIDPTKCSKGWGIDLTPDIKESLPLSIVFMCPAGIIHNFNKIEKVNCGYLDCLYNQVGKVGFPVAHCEKLKDYLHCRMYAGWLVGGWLNKYTRQVAQAFASFIVNPLQTVLGYGVNIYCNYVQHRISPDGGLICALYHGSRAGKNLWAQGAALKQTWWDMEGWGHTPQCEALIKKIKEDENFKGEDTLAPGESVEDESSTPELENNPEEEA